MTEIKSIGILSIGEMGHACARLFRQNGARVLTVLEGRSERTRALARDAGVEVLGDLKALVGTADVVLSLVTPSSAMKVAQQAAGAMAGSEGAGLFVDANPTSPMAAEEIAGLIASAGGRFVDGAVIGSASDVGRRTALCVSGPGAGDLKQIERFGLRVDVVGEKVGQASALKMFYAGLNKGVAALLFELLLGASKVGVLDEVVERYNDGFREIVTRMNGFLTGFSLHARRRSEEMVELEATLRHWGIEPVMTPAVYDVLARMAALRLDPIQQDPEGYRRLIRTLDEKGFLSDQ